MLVFLDVLVALLAIIKMDEHISEIMLEISPLLLSQLVLLFLELGFSHRCCSHLISLIPRLSLAVGSLSRILLSCILACICKSILHHLRLHVVPVAAILLLLLHHLLILSLILLLLGVSLLDVIHVLLATFEHVNVNLQVIALAIIFLILVHSLV